MHIHSPESDFNLLHYMMNFVIRNLLQSNTILFQTFEWDITVQHLEKYIKYNILKYILLNMLLSEGIGLTDLSLSKSFSLIYSCIALLLRN